MEDILIILESKASKTEKKLNTYDTHDPETVVNLRA